MRTLRATPHRITGESANYLMLGRETRLPPDILHPVSSPSYTEVEYVQDLQKRLQLAGAKLREQQQQTPWTDDLDEPRFTPGDKVWLKSYYKGKGRGAKLLPKYVGPYEIVRCLPHQVYEMSRHGRTSIQHEGRIKAYNPRATHEDKSAPDKHQQTTRTLEQVAPPMPLRSQKMPNQVTAKPRGGVSDPPPRTTSVTDDGSEVTDTPADVTDTSPVTLDTPSVAADRSEVTDPPSNAVDPPSEKNTPSKKEHTIERTGERGADRASNQLHPPQERTQTPHMDPRFPPRPSHHN